MSDLRKLAIKLATEGPVKVLSTPRRIQLLHNGVYILKTINAAYVWEHPYYPQFYVPREDLASSADQGHLEIREGEAYHTEDGQHIASQLLLKVRDRSIDQAITFGDKLSGKAATLRGMVKIDFGSVDQWFEEDTPIFVHPKDPFKRIDILHSQRHVQVAIDGKFVADTTTSQHLYETGLPARFYLPLTAIDATILRPSETKSQCPYKGEAEYYSIEINGKLHKDVVWYYNRPTLESASIVGLVCFYNENVDIYLDGQKLSRPTTHFGSDKPNVKPSVVE